MKNIQKINDFFHLPLTILKSFTVLYVILSLQFNTNEKKKQTNKHLKKEKQNIYARAWK